MRALAAHGVGGIRMVEAPRMRPTRAACVVDIRAFGVNRGEIRRLRGDAPGCGADVAVVPRARRSGARAARPRDCRHGRGGSLRRAARSRAAGASVTASVRSLARAEALGVEADEIVAGTGLGGPFDIVLDSVGADHLAAGLRAAACGATVVSLGNTAAAPAILDGDWAEPMVRMIKFRGSGAFSNREVTQPLGFMLAGIADGALDVGPFREMMWGPAAAAPDISLDASGAKTIVTVQWANR